MKIKISKSQWEKIGAKAGWRALPYYSHYDQKKLDDAKKYALTFRDLDNAQKNKIINATSVKEIWEVLVEKGIERIKDVPTAIHDYIKKTKMASGHGRFSKDLSDILEGQILVNKSKTPQEIANIIKKDHGLVYLMREEAMTNAELMDVIDGTLQLYSWMR